MESTGHKETNGDSSNRHGHKHRSHDLETMTCHRHVSRHDHFERMQLPITKSCILASNSVGVAAYKCIPPMARLKGVLKKEVFVAIDTATEYRRSVDEMTMKTDPNEDGLMATADAAVCNDAKNVDENSRPKKSVRFAVDDSSERVSCKSKHGRSSQKGSSSKRTSRQKSRSKKARNGSAARSISQAGRGASEDFSEQASSRRSSSASLSKKRVDTAELQPLQGTVILPTAVGGYGFESIYVEGSHQSIPDHVRKDSDLTRLRVEGNNGVSCDHSRDENKGTRTVRTQTFWCLHHPKSTQASWTEGCNTNLASKATMTDITLPPSLQGTPLAIDGVLYIPLHTALRTGLPLTMWERIMQKAVLKVISDQKYKQYHRRQVISHGRRKP